jgi:hypothetical protein
MLSARELAKNYGHVCKPLAFGDIEGMSSCLDRYNITHVGSKGNQAKVGGKGTAMVSNNSLFQTASTDQNT